ncbi:cytidine deaminase [Undibacterium sp. CY7W]|uniref:Cytidine deaminase n=1 Tax=Undibacterium rugosum TaxID=2762291 RepID=A0A923I2B5_9BURK|nr:cytidine deaminase [Undibacterium rugosum]MBC3934719.1 cytidine deaminase [Undibacterium rugosum]
MKACEACLFFPQDETLTDESKTATENFDMQDQELIALANQAREKAYAPYSRFLVGAALLTKDGKVFQGCNVENASYGLCNCAERTALFSAIAAGYRPREFAKIAVTGNTEAPIAPCGACRQVLLELGGPELDIILTNLKGDIKTTTAGAQLPDAFYLQRE